MNAIHGGDVWQVAEELGIDPAELLDFSANINPRGLPARAAQRLAEDAADAALLLRYPDPEARALRRRLSERLGLPVESIVVGAGAEALLAPALAAARANSVLVPVPAFSEYRRICEARGLDFIPLALSRADGFQLPTTALFEKASQTDAVILNNPHNPTGGFTELRQIVNALTASGKTVVLDEAFIDYMPLHSLAVDAAHNPRLIAVRSLTKFYGCPALRAGYAVGHPRTIEAIRSLLPCWSVAQSAMDALTEALQDREYEAETIRTNALARQSLQHALASAGLRVLPSAANYLLVELGTDMPTSASLRRRLAERHRILIRNCDSYEGLAAGRWIRIAVRSSADNERLVSTLKMELKTT